MAENRMVVTIHLDDEVKAALDEAKARHDELRRENALISGAVVGLVDLIQDALHQHDDLPWPFVKEQMGARFTALMERMEQAMEQAHVEGGQ